MSLRKVFSRFFLTSAIVLAWTPGAHAVWKGTEVISPTRAVPVIFQEKELYCASGWLYSSRIVFTAAHVLYFGNDMTNNYTTVRNKIWFGLPGSTVDYGMKLVESEKIFVPDNFVGRDAFRGGNFLTRQNDFGVVVLKEPIQIDDKPVEFLTEAMHDQFISDKESIEFTGYGLQGPNDTNTCFKRKPMKTSMKIASKTIDASPFKFTTTLNFQVAPNESNLCDGDSGSGYVKDYGDKYLYLAANGAGSFMNHNCETWKEAIGSTTYNGADPVYKYMDLIKQAEEYVKANPYVAPVIKKSIKCFKGKKVITVKTESPSCPKGYKQK